MATPPIGSTLVPCLRYRDAPAAIDWLCRVLGLERQLVVQDDSGLVQHAQLTSARGMLMLGSVRPGAYGDNMKLPDEVAGASTQSIYFVVDDADAVYARVQAAGAPIVLPIVDEPYGGRGFTFRDLEGHVWSVGSYDPWQEPDDHDA